jgi:enoyl-CoA hydratase/carnithine racemase
MTKLALAIISITPVTCANLPTIDARSRGALADAPAASSAISTVISGRTATVSLSQPPLNTLTNENIDALRSQLEQLAANPTAKVVVLTGAGGKPILGLDPALLTGWHSVADVSAFRARFQGLLSTMEELPKPVIYVAHDGPVVGAGLELALAAHIRVISTGATFASVETAIGIMPGGGASQRLPRIVGQGIANELVLTGRPIASDEALRLGLANKVSPQAEVLGAAQTMAAAIAAKRSISNQNALKALYYHWVSGADLDEGLRVEADLFDQVFDPAALAQGLHDFLAGTPTVFND